MSVNGISIQLFGFLLCLAMKECESAFEVSLTHREVFKPNDKTAVNFDKLMVKKVNRTHPHMFIGEIELFVAFDDSIEILLLLNKKSGNEYKRLPYKIGPTPFCQFIKSETMFFPVFHNATDFPAIESCPWQPGKYHVLGFQPDLSKIPPYFASGDYMADCQFLKNEEVLQGMKSYVSFLNKDVWK